MDPIYTVYRDIFPTRTPFPFHRWFSAAWLAGSTSRLRRRSIA